MRYIGMSSIGFKHTDEDFAKLRASGLNAVELALSSKIDIDLKEFARMANDHDVKLWSCHLPYSPFEVFDVSLESAEIRKKAIEFNSEKIKILSDLGIDKFVLHPSTPIPETSDRNERKKCTMDSFAKLAEVAGQCGSVIAAEDMILSCLGNSADELLEIISVDDRIKVCFDVNHLFNDTHIEFAKKASDKIVTMHISDYDFIEERHWFPGNGKINWPELYNVMCDIGYNGAWIYELGLRTKLPTGDFMYLNFEDFYNNSQTIFSGKHPQKTY